jgi:hypothetical protein
MKALCLALLVLALVASVACSKPSTFVAQDQRTTSEASRPHDPSSASTQATRDLSRDEAAGGHTLARHVGRSDNELRERLSHEHISAASTYTDRALAERTLAAAIAANQVRLQSWLDSRGGHPNLVLGYDAPQPIGRTLHRNESSSMPCSHAVVVLKWRPPSSYFVLTSYPECR